LGRPAAAQDLVQPLRLADRARGGSAVGLAELAGPAARNRPGRGPGPAFARRAVHRRPRPAGRPGAGARAVPDAPAAGAGRAEAGGGRVRLPVRPSGRGLDAGHGHGRESGASELPVATRSRPARDRRAWGVVVARRRGAARGGRMSEVTRSLQDGILTLSLNRPEKKNALTQGMY